MTRIDLFKRIQKHHIIGAIELINKEGYPPSRRSNLYDLVFESVAYPPKYVIALAGVIDNGKFINEEFEGGEGTACFNHLRELGFKILPKEQTRSLSQAKSNQEIEDKYSGGIAKNPITQLEDRRKRKYWRVGTTDEIGSYWDLMKEGNYVSIGWSDLGDLSHINSKDEVQNLLENKGYYVGQNSLKSRKAKEIFDFVRNINEDDIVLAQDGSRVRGIGIVGKGYEFKSSEIFPHCKPVSWKLEPENFSYSGGNQTTVKEITEQEVIAQINTFLQGRGLEESKLPAIAINEIMSKNIILFGPPGTGKTYKLLKEYVPMFTAGFSDSSHEQYKSELLISHSWWQVVAAVVLELKSCRVSEILGHPMLQMKHGLSDTKNARARIWSTLQSHTILECENVRYTNRQEPLVFSKDGIGNWTIDKQIIENEAPEVLGLLESWRRPVIKPDEVKRYEFITFHQSYSYEDFIEGIKPRIEGEEQEGDIQYGIKDGIFKLLCSRARRDPNSNYALFIDEINRGNVSQIFGELITLIEEDKREGKLGVEVELPYSKSKFSVPSNVHIIGTMNTADRSVEALDTALRRRFSFKEVPPNPTLIASDGKLKDRKGLVDGIDLVKVNLIINRRIEKLLDKDHLIGHSFFMDVANIDDLKLVFHDKIAPLLQEYFYGDPGKVGLVLGVDFFEVDSLKSTEGPEFFARFPGYDTSGLVDRPIYRLKNISKMKDETFVEAVKNLLQP